MFCVSNKLHITYCFQYVHTTSAFFFDEGASKAAACLAAAIFAAAARSSTGVRLFRGVNRRGAIVNKNESVKVHFGVDVRDNLEKIMISGDQNSNILQATCYNSLFWPYLKAGYLRSVYNLYDEGIRIKQYFEVRMEAVPYSIKPCISTSCLFP